MSEIEKLNLSDSSSDDYLDDDAYFKKNAKYANFLTDMNINSEEKGKRERRQMEEESDDIEKEYEKGPRRSSQMQAEEYLPTITEDGTLHVSKKVKVRKEQPKSPEASEDSEDETGKKSRKVSKKEQKKRDKKKALEEKEMEEDENLLNNDETPTIELTPEQQAKQKEQHYELLMTQIAVNCEKIIENPTKGVTRKSNEICPLNQVLICLRDEDLRIRLLAMLSLLKVFDDILPNYPIHLASKEEKTGQLKKEVRKLRQYEESLMTFYTSYVKTLTKLSRNRNSKNQEEITAVRCLCTLLKNHYQFNLSDMVSKAIIPFAFSSNREISQIVHSCFEEVFRGDPQGQITFSIVQQLANSMKTRNYRIPPESIHIFLELPLHEALVEGDELGRKSRKKKRLSEVDKIMAESEGPDPAVYKAFQKDTLQEVLLTYFRILKLPKNGALIHVVLEGLAKFGHLLNSHIIGDLLELLKSTLLQNNFPVENCLKCVLASLRLMHIASSVISTDDGSFISKLYATRYDYLQPRYHHLIPDFLECIDMAFLQRKELLHERVAAFTKALTTLSLQLPPVYAAACISLSRDLMRRYPMYSSLLENEEGRRINGEFRIERDVPEQANGHAATLWENCLLRKHYDIHVVKVLDELEGEKTSGAKESWKEILKKDFSHKIFTIKKVTKAKDVVEEMDEEEIDDVVEDMFGSDQEEESSD